MNEIKIGNYIKKDGQAIGDRIFDCDDWDEADFRYPNPITEWRESHAIACKIKITGRKERFFQGAAWMRIEITWIGDCEPDTITRGFVMIENDEDRIRNANAFGIGAK